MEPTTTFDTAFWITAGVIFFLLMMSAFFSGSETALTAASRGKLRAQADKGSRGAQRALNITEDSERLIGSVLLGNNLVNILATSLATALFTRAFGEGGVALATLVMTLLVLIFAEVLPKTYAITRPEDAASTVASPISLIVTLFSPSCPPCGCWCVAYCACLVWKPTRTARCSPCAKRSLEPFSSAIPKASWKKKTATASWRAGPV